MIFSNIKSFILTKPRKVKRYLVICMDLSLSLLAVSLAFYLRIGEFIPIWDQRNEYYPLPACIAALLISSLVFNYFNFYKVIFRFLGSQVIINITKAFIVYGVIYTLIFTIIGFDGVPRTIGIIQPLLFFLLIGFTRFFAYYFLGQIDEQKPIKTKERQAIIYGAGNKGYQLSRALYLNKKINIVGFFDDDISLYGNKINNLNIFNPKEIDKLIISKKVNEIIFALEGKNTNHIKKVMDKFKGKSLSLRTLPSYEDLVHDNVQVNNIRKLSIEDILGREQVRANPKLIQFDIKDKVVMITGAGGSIGRELCQQVYKMKPKKIVLLDHSEIALYTILEKLKKFSNSSNTHINIVARLGSITDKTLVTNLLQETNPETIYHTAAYKHVPLLEINTVECIKNNVFGTLTLAQSAINKGTKKFILISSDKAVRPSSIMGATKRISEMILQSLSTQQTATTFAIVRFGNVLNSSGSVVPLFKSQIKAGGPITLTDINITRYFMTLSEAAELVIQAGAMTKRNKISNISTPIYILDMGKPIKIYDLAKIMVELSGFTLFDKVTGEGDIEIKIIGMRPGEKLHEELFFGNSLNKTIHSKINYVNEVCLPWYELNDKIEKISRLIKVNDEKYLDTYIQELVFRPEKAKNEPQ